MNKWLDANCVGIRNVGYLIIFGGCYGLGGVGNGASTTSSAGGSDDWLWEDTDSLSSSYAWQYANESAKSVNNSYTYDDRPLAVAAGAVDATTNATVVPVWVVVLVGSWWNFGGAMQVCHTRVAQYAAVHFDNTAHVSLETFAIIPTDAIRLVQCRRQVFRDCTLSWLAIAVKACFSHSSSFVRVNNIRILILPVPLSAVRN
jgi:hypothetical protein